MKLTYEEIPLIEVLVDEIFLNQRNALRNSCGSRKRWVEDNELGMRGYRVWIFCEMKDVDSMRSFDNNRGWGS
jgi:hypothetical protein